jgi:hypothetical protein
MASKNMSLESDMLLAHVHLLERKQAIFRYHLLRNCCWVWWYMPVIPACGRLKQEDCEFSRPA